MRKVLQSDAVRSADAAAQLEEFYGVRLNVPSSLTLDEAIRRLLGKGGTHVGSVVRFQEIALHVRELTSTGAVASVGMVVLPQNDNVSSTADALR